MAPAIAKIQHNGFSINAKAAEIVNRIIKVISAFFKEISPLAKGRFLVRVTAPPIEGRANKAVIELLAKHFKISKSKVDIIKGVASRIKIIDVG